MEEILGDFDASRSLLDDFKDRVEDLLRQCLDERGVRVRSVEGRVKTRSSLERKLETHATPYRSLDAITDLLGVRIITYFPDDFEKVRKLVEDEFNVDHGNSYDRRIETEPGRFGYRCPALVVSLSRAREALPEWSRLAGRRFEIQVPSRLEHAWAEIEHDLWYKAPKIVPPHVQRRWLRLAALLEIADSEFMALRDASAPAYAAGRERAAPLRSASPDDRIGSIAVTSAGSLAPGRSSASQCSVSIQLAHPHVGVGLTITMALETPGVAFEGTPILASAAGSDASIRFERSGRNCVVESLGRTAAPHVLTVAGLSLSVAPDARPGPVQASIAVDRGHRRLMSPLGAIGVAASVHVAVVPIVTLDDEDQATGLVSITERATGALSAGHILRLRLVDISDPDRSGGPVFAQPPWLKVSSGDLRLGEGGIASSDNVVEGRVADDDRTCAEWLIWKASSLPSSLQIGSSGFSSGPHIGIGGPPRPGTIGWSVETVDGEGAVHARSLTVLGFREARESSPR